MKKNINLKNMKKNNTSLNNKLNQHHHQINRNLNNNSKKNNNQNLNNENNLKDDDALSKRGKNLLGTNNKINQISQAIDMRKQMDNMSTSEKMKMVMKIPAVRAIIIKIAIITIPIIILLLLVIFMIASLGNNSKSRNIAMRGYYKVPCDEVTVNFADKSNGYEIYDTKVYPFEEYVAGVVSGEVGFFGSLEVDKTFAVAARSFFVNNHDNCTIESSDRKQVFRELSDSYADKLAIEAANETEGEILLVNNAPFSSQYDAFACIGKDSNYYTISQANQKIPIEWMNGKLNPASTPGWFICNGRENLQNHHGNGISQYGSLYLASELGYKYDEILSFYLSEYNVTISKAGFISSVAGLEVKDTTNSEILTISLNEFLGSVNSSTSDLNNFIYENVTDAGKGTREGVVAATVSLINYLYDNFNLKLPYYWGGQYQQYGLDGSFGGQVGASCTGATCYYNKGFDCSGFVSWAIKNGGFKIGRNTTTGFADNFSGDSCYVTDNNCIGQPGDLINERGLHVIMIVAVDEESGNYMVAESAGDLGLIMRERPIHSVIGSNETKILHMDPFYNDVNNIDQNY